jgi:Flp pilus assembly protein TadG
MRIPRSKRRGQALIMVTLAGIAMCGLAGLAVDLGWSFFIKKQAQAAADAAALASVHDALARLGQVSSFACAADLTCQALAPCAMQPPNPAGNNIDVACLYAQRNGFQTGGYGGRQNVTVISDATPTPPTVPGVVVDYWVTVRVAQSVPQLFAALISPQSLVSARATAAIVKASVAGSLLLLNRENDCLPMESVNSPTCGVDLLVSANDNQGQEAVRADGGIYMASQQHGATAANRYAGENTGGGTVRAPFTYIRGNGSHMVSGSSTWVQTPQNRSGDSQFLDPMRGKGQPRPPTGLANHAIIGGVIQGSSDPANPAILPPGNYYAAAWNNGQLYATGNPLDVNGYAQFGTGAAGFSEFVIYGGVNIQQPNTNVTFAPGMYVFAGVRPQANGAPNPVFALSSNASLQDLTPGFGQSTDAGELFVFTDTNYVGQGQALEIPPLVAPIASQLKQGTAGFKTGNSPGLQINLHGINRNHAALRPDLTEFSPVIIWQDQANSVVKYTADGHIDRSCGQDGCPNAALASNQSPEMYLQGAVNVHLYGTVYQPRGAWTSIAAGGNYQVPVQVIAGAFRVQGTASFDMAQVPSPLTRRTAALIE